MAKTKTMTTVRHTKGSVLKSRFELMRQRGGSEGAVDALLAALSVEEARLARTALSGSWIPFDLVNHFDEQIVARLGGDLAVCEQIGALSARLNLPTLYHAFVDQSERDPFRLLEHIAMLHTTIYDFGWSRARRLSPSECLMEADYATAATRVNCVGALGFYREALRVIEVEGVTAVEQGCQATGAPLCSIRLAWTPA